MLEVKNARRATKGLPAVTREDYRRDLGGDGA